MKSGWGSGLRRSRACRMYLDPKEPTVVGFLVTKSLYKPLKGRLLGVKVCLRLRVWRLGLIGFIVFKDLGFRV